MGMKYSLTTYRCWPDPGCGLVVDDAIVMLENIMRHVENGKRLCGRAQGVSRGGFTIISISTSLIAVFIPIFFMPG